MAVLFQKRLFRNGRRLSRESVRTVLFSLNNRPPARAQKRLMTITENNARSGAAAGVLPHSGQSVAKRQEWLQNIYKIISKKLRFALYFLGEKGYNIVTAEC